MRGCGTRLGTMMFYRSPTGNVTFHWCCSEFHHGTWASGTAARGEDPPDDYLAAPLLGIHRETRNTSQLYHRQENLVGEVRGRGPMPVEHSSRVVSYPHPGPVERLSSLFQSAHRHHTATCPGLVVAILLLPMHKTLVLDRVLCLPLLGIQPGIIKVGRNLWEDTEWPKSTAQCVPGRH